MADKHICTQYVCTECGTSSTLTILRQIPKDIIQSIVKYFSREEPAICEIAEEKDEYERRNIIYFIKRHGKLKLCATIKLSYGIKTYGAREFLDEDGYFEFADGDDGWFELMYDKINDNIVYIPHAPDFTLPSTYFKARYYKEVFKTMVRDLEERCKKLRET